MKILITFAFASLLSCGRSETAGSTTAGNQEREVQVSFSTRLNTQLMFSGHECQGHESVWFKEQQYFCNQGQWLVVVDNVNKCSEEGVCTEVAVEPSIMKLHFRHGQAQRSLIPISPLRKDQRYWVRRVWVNFNSGTGRVDWRYESSFKL